MESHRCACCRPLPKTHHRQAGQGAQNGLTWIARALIGTRAMPRRISREAADQPQPLSVTGTLARRVPYRRIGAVRVRWRVGCAEPHRIGPVRGAAGSARAAAYRARPIGIAGR